MMENEQQPSPPATEDASGTTPAQDQVKMEPGVKSDKTVPSSARKMPGWLRLGLIVLGVAVVLYFAGFLTDHFVRYQPMQTEFKSTKQQLADLEKQATGLTSQLTAANSQLTGLKSDKTGLQADLTAANNHIELLRAVSEIQAGQIALQNADISGAKVALVNTLKRLENIKPVVQPVDATLAENMSNRLDAILKTIDSNSGTAKTDLALLAKNLLNIEALLYK